MSESVRWIRTRLHRPGALSALAVGAVFATVGLLFLPTALRLLAELPEGTRLLSRDGLHCRKQTNFQQHFHRGR